MSPTVRDILASLTLANFILLKEWRLLLGNMMYFNRPNAMRFVAIVFCSVLFAAVFFYGIRLARRSGNWGHLFAKWLFVQLIVFGICLLNSSRIPGALFAPALVLTPLLLVAHPYAPKAIATLLVAISPCVGYLYLRGGWEVTRASSPQVVQGSMAGLEKDGPRVLVLIFDALGENVPFTERPEGMELPAFDRLRAESVVATGAYPPANQTLLSIPALLTSKLVTEAHPRRGSLTVKYEHEDRFHDLSGARTIFSQVHEEGLGTAMIGWYHPYCYILRDLDFCAHAESDVQDERYERGGFSDKVLDVFAGLPIFRDTPWGRDRNGDAARASHEIETLFLSQRTRDALPHFHSGLMVVHLPIPHPPAKEGVYFANLAEADDVVALVRGIMEKAGTWQGATVVVTSDHWWRTRTLDRDFPRFSWTGEELAYLDADEDKRVPFIVKLPGQITGVKYGKEFNTVILSKLIRESLSGNIQSADDLRAFLDTRRSDVNVHAYLGNKE